MIPMKSVNFGIVLIAGSAIGLFLCLVLGISVAVAAMALSLIVIACRAWIIVPRPALWARAAFVLLAAVGSLYAALVVLRRAALVEVSQLMTTGLGACIAGMLVVLWVTGKLDH
jgi:hypothetical protein